MKKILDLLAQNTDSILKWVIIIFILSLIFNHPVRIKHIGSHRIPLRLLEP